MYIVMAIPLGKSKDIFIIDLGSGPNNSGLAFGLNVEEEMGRAPDWLLLEPGHAKTMRLLLKFL